MKIRTTLLTAAASVLMVALGSTQHAAAAAQDAPQHIDITAKRFAFAPAEITVKKGQPVVLEFKSQDVSHGLHIDELNIQTVIPKGGTSEVPFTAEKTGDFVGHCAVFCGAGHGGMTLTIHVVE